MASSASRRVGSRVSSKGMRLAFTSSMILFASALASSAGAAALPSFIPLPLGFEAGNSVRESEFDHAIFELPGRVVEVEGKQITAHLAASPPLEKEPEDALAMFRPLLEKSGWEILLQDTSTIIARRSAENREQWLRIASWGSEDNRLVYAEKGIPKNELRLSKPRSRPERVSRQNDFPFLRRLRGCKLIETSEELGLVNAVEDDTDEAVPGLVVTKRYGSCPAQTTMHELVAVYKAALEKMGWSIQGMFEGEEDSGLIAHYVKGSRDLWAEVHGRSPDDVRLRVLDVGKDGASRKLKEELAKKGRVSVYGLYFELGTSELRADSEVAINEIKELLERDRALTLEIQAHTDDSGGREANQLLSDERAASIKAKLVEHGISEERVTAKGCADTTPIASNESPIGRATNRRVELVKR
jgi:outer membrane protein OmpA-like peptidoglycan-associated protein